MWRAMRISLAALALLGTAGTAYAEKVYVGSKGGLTCEKPDEMLSMLEQKMKGEPVKIGPSCGAIAPSSVIEVNKVENVTDEVAVGVGSIDGGKASAFVIWRDTIPPVDANRTFKRVSPTDVRNAPDKWKGRPIEFAKAQVYWVASDDIRIVNDALVTIFATKVGGPDAVWLSENCETQDEALSRKCRVTARFIYHGYSEDNPTPITKRTVLASRDVTLIREAQPERRRR